MRSRNQDLSSVKLDLGATFRRSLQFNMVETARIIAVAADAGGIPHVRFSLRLAGPRATMEEQRTLSLESFRRLYPEFVAAGG
jgi:hypothetical protein